MGMLKVLKVYTCIKLLNFSCLNYEQMHFHQYSSSSSIVVQKNYHNSTQPMSILDH